MSSLVDISSKIRKHGLELSDADGMRLRAC